MNEIIIKYAHDDVLKELYSIGVDKSYIETAQKKYKGNAYKVFNLRPYEANILKQLCLSLGFDCAVNRGTVTCNCEYTDAILLASDAQINLLSEKLKLQPFNLRSLAFEFDKVVNSQLEPMYGMNYKFDWSRPYIMGVLNVTPDSFSDGGKYLDVDAAVSHVVNLIEDGADIIDIGAESTRPGADEVPVDVEMQRILPVIKEIRTREIDIPISVDTRNYETAQKAVQFGANIINDVSGFEFDSKLFDFVCKNNISSVVVHSDKVPASNSDFTSKDIVEEVYVSLYKKIEKMYHEGLSKDNIIIDTGIGFGKSREACIELLKRQKEFASLKQPILLGISRKSFIRDTFNLSCEDADIPTALYSALASNVNIHRVHNVKLLKQFLEYSSVVK